MDRESSKLAIFIPSLDGGGAERAMVNLATELGRIGVQVDLVLCERKGPYIADVPPWVRIVDLGKDRVLKCIPPLVRYLRRERPTALLSGLEHSNLVAIAAKILSGVPTRLAISVRNTMSWSFRSKCGWKDRIIRRLVKRFYGRADVIVCVSKGVAVDLRETLGLPGDKIRVIYNPIVTRQMQASAETAPPHWWFETGEVPIILGVGRLMGQKDFGTLIRAFSRVRRPARLVILGEGEERGRLERLARQLGVDGNLWMPGFVDNPFSFMKQADVFVLSSRWEGLPGVLIQAMACGTPVVSTNCPSGPEEILEGGKWGKLVPVGDEMALARAIEEVLDGDAVSPLAGSERFTAARVSEQYCQVLGLGWPEPAQAETASARPSESRPSKRPGVRA